MAFIVLLTFAMSRILLNVPKQIATAVALMVAFNILVAAALVALRPELKGAQRLLLGGVFVLPVVLGGLVAAGAVEVKGGDEHGQAEHAGKVVAIAAQNNAFDEPELKVPAGQAFKLKFDNKDPAPHNVAILKEKGATEALFRKEPFPGSKAVTWEVKKLAAGEYFFQCDVHPNMTGKVIAEGGSVEHAGSGAEKSDAVEVSAKNIAFNTKKLQAPANVGFKLQFENNEAAPHNVAILKAKGSPEVLLREPPFPGPKKATWDVDPLPPGTYYFQCDVHPNMSGELIIA